MVQCTEEDFWNIPKFYYSSWKWLYLYRRFKSEQSENCETKTLQQNNDGAHFKESYYSRMKQPDSFRNFKYWAKTKCYNKNSGNQTC